MSCTYYAEKHGDHYCTAKGGYISCYCSYDDKSCRYYPNSEDVTDCGCPYWSSGNYCQAKKGYVSGNCDYNYTSCVYYNEGNGSGGCFLTTACVEWKGLPDDCDELQTLRKYRDTYLNSFEDGRKDVEQYYKIAPGIVERITNSPNKDKLLESIYTELVLPCVDLIKKGKYSEAHWHYKTYVWNLYGEFCK